MATFVLIHGGYHGGWCWAPFVEVLEARGHRAIAPDLPIDDPAAGFDEYAAAVLDAMDRSGVAGSSPLVVVGHSLGCYIAPLVAARRPCDHLFFLCAVPAALGQPIAMESSAILTEELLGVSYFADANGCTMQTPESFFRLFYGDVAPEQALSALRRLRPQGSRPLVDSWPLLEWPAAARTVVLAEQDHVVRLDAGREAAKALTGEEPLVVPGGHSVFLTDPERLADLLIGRCAP
jgi:pimeloyl-ACP methyl ester carboxylesterase